MKVTVAQPAYYCGERPDEKIASFLSSVMTSAERGSLTVLPEYSNAGGLSDPEEERRALSRAPELLRIASDAAAKNGAYLVINVLEERAEKLRNSTYLFDRQGNAAFIYDKIHLPPSELALGVSRGDGSCVCELDGIRFAFMTCYDVYYNEQIEHIAAAKPDVILVPGYQRGERTDIIRAQAKLTAFRCNAFLLRSSYSMGSDERGGCSMIVSPDGTILADMGKEVGALHFDIDEKWKYMRPAGFGGGMVRNDAFISMGLCPDAFR